MKRAPFCVGLCAEFIYFFYIMKAVIRLHNSLPSPTGLEIANPRRIVYNSWNFKQRMRLS